MTVGFPLWRNQFDSHPSGALAMKDTAMKQSSRMLALKQRAQVRNRQQTVLGRAAHSVGIPDNEPLFFNHVQGKIRPGHVASYERHGGCMS
jgi:hypothetical protein